MAIIPAGDVFFPALTTTTYTADCAVGKSPKMKESRCQGWVVEQKGGGAAAVVISGWIDRNKPTRLWCFFQGSVVVCVAVSITGL